MAERSNVARELRLALCVWLIGWLIDVWPREHETFVPALELSTRLLGLLGAEVPGARAHG